MFSQNQPHFPSEKLRGREHCYCLPCHHRRLLHLRSRRKGRGRRRKRKEKRTGRGGRNAQHHTHSLSWTHSPHGQHSRPCQSFLWSGRTQSPKGPEAPQHGPLQSTQDAHHADCVHAAVSNLGWDGLVSYRLYCRKPYKGKAQH